MLLNKLKAIRLNLHTVYILLLVCEEISYCQIYLRNSMNSEEEQRQKADKCEIDDAKGNEVTLKSSVEVTSQPSCKVPANPSDWFKAIETDRSSNCCPGSKEDCETNYAIVASLPEIKEDDKNRDVDILEEDEVDCEDIDNTASSKKDGTSKIYPSSMDQNIPTGEKSLESIDNQDSQIDENHSSLDDIAIFSESAPKDLNQNSSPGSQNSQQSEDNADDVYMLNDDDIGDNAAGEKNAVEKPGSDNSNSQKNPAREKGAVDLDLGESEARQLNLQPSIESHPPKTPAPATDMSQGAQGISDPTKMGTALKKPKKKKRSKKDKTFFHYGDRDTENYRKGYPDLKDKKQLNKNLMFYKGMIASEPDGDLIDTIHAEWRNNFSLLEHHHGYIQWIFPIRENGMNFHAQPLQLHEAKVIMEDKVAHARVLESYKMMLNFYGMELEDERTGKIQRSRHYKKCFENLSERSHNFLRITRILKSLGELGYEHLKKPFLEFVLYEALVEGTLSKTLDSCRNYWIGTIKDDAARKELYMRIEEHSKYRSTSKRGSLP